MNHHDSVVIRWSDENQAYLVVLPEFGPEAQTHGDTYQSAIQNAQEVLELLVESYEAELRPLPVPARFDKPVPA